MICFSFITYCIEKYFNRTFELQSLASREYVKEQFAWRHHYWYLTNEGIDYLREYLHLPAEIVPSTVKAKQREPRPGFERMSRGSFV